MGLELIGLDQKGPPAKADRQLVARFEPKHLAQLLRIHQIGGAQHRHRIGGFEVLQPPLQLHGVAHHKGLGRKRLRVCGLVHTGWWGGRRERPWWHDPPKWSQTRRDQLRALATWSGAIAGLLLILVGGLIQAAAPLPAANGAWSLATLPITLQVPALLLTALVCGPRSAMLAAVAYLSLGLFQLPVFHGGGGAAYLLDPGFGYLAGFIPAAWLTGKLARQPGMDDLLSLLGAAVVGLGVLQLCGIANLLLGALAGRWGPNLGVLLISYSVAPLLPQLLLCCGVAVVALLLRRLLLVEP